MNNDLFLEKYFGFENGPNNTKFKKGPYVYIYILHSMAIQITIDETINQTNKSKLKHFQINFNYFNYLLAKNACFKAFFCTLAMGARYFTSLLAGWAFR